MKDMICETTARLGRQVYHDRLRAVVLTGSLARNEATFVNDGQGWRLLGDAEFMLVFGERDVLPSDADLTVISRKIEERIRRDGVRAEVTLSALGPSYLRRLPPSIFAYELRACGETVVGDTEVLGLIREFTPGDIPLEDAWRMLANRLVEQLESVNELLEGRPTLSSGAYYRTVKLYLDMATSLLVFVGRYAPTYAERAKILASLAEQQGHMTTWPFPLGPFADKVAACTEWKLSTADRGTVSRAFWEDAVDHARALWRWELARLQGGDANGSSAHVLMARWMQRQPVRDRLRGWAYVIRQNGWHRSWLRWPQWARLALAASPRYSVYAAACDLLFGIRSSESLVAKGSNGRSFWEELRRQLPVVTCPGPANGRPPWHDLATDVLFNYRKFLVNTRS